jgi:hypothetical protein
MKLVFDSLDALLTELRDRKVDVVRVSPAVEVDRSRQTDGVPHVVARVLVTAALDDHRWAEWRHWVGRAIADVGPAGGVQLPASIRQQRDRALAEISKRVDEAGFQIRQGIVTHDTGVMDCFTPLRTEGALGERDRPTAAPPRGHYRVRLPRPLSSADRAHRNGSRSATPDVATGAIVVVRHQR